MSVQHSTGGSGANKQFVDTIGGYTQAGGEDFFTITVFSHNQQAVTGNPTQGNIFFREVLATLIGEAGYAPIKTFQFYKISKVEYWFHDLDYGESYSTEPQGWNVYMAPWKISPYIIGSSIANIKPNYMPGCVWKNFSAPTIANTHVKTPNSSGNSQMLTLEVYDPPFEMNVYNPGGTSIEGRQMNNTYLPTYTHEGVDTTKWQTVLFHYKRYSGYTATPNPIYFMFMTKTTFHFKGTRCLLTSALDDKTYSEEELAQMRARHVILTHSRRVSVNSPTTLNTNTSDNMGPNTKRRKTDRTTHELC